MKSFLHYLMFSVLGTYSSAVVSNWPPLGLNSARLIYVSKQHLVSYMPNYFLYFCNVDHPTRFLLLFYFLASSDVFVCLASPALMRTQLRTKPLSTTPAPTPGLLKEKALVKRGLKPLTQSLHRHSL